VSAVRVSGPVVSGLDVVPADEQRWLPVSRRYAKRVLVDVTELVGEKRATLIERDRILEERAS
jgi:hypothetical protein